MAETPVKVPTAKLLPAITTSKEAKARASIVHAAMSKAIGAADVAFADSHEMLSDVRYWISTGFPEIDIILGGGLASGRISEWYGPEASGKSTLVHVALRETQRRGGVAVLIDVEGALDTKKAQQVGIDLSTLVYARPDTLNAAFEAVLSACQAMVKAGQKGPILIALDSVAAAPAQDEIEADGNASRGAQARVVAAYLRKLVKPLQKADAHLMIVNQERANLKDQSKYAEKNTPCGEALKFYCSQRTRCYATRITRGSDEDKVVIGYRSFCTSRKSRMAPPHRRGSFVIDFAVGPSVELSAYQFLTEKKILKQAGAWWTAPWTTEKFMRKQWLELMQDPEFREPALECYRKTVAAQYETGAATVTGADAEDDD